MWCSCSSEYLPAFQHVNSTNLNHRNWALSFKYSCTPLRHVTAAGHQPRMNLSLAYFISSTSNSDTNLLRHSRSTHKFEVENNTNKNKTHQFFTWFDSFAYIHGDHISKIQLLKRAENTKFPSSLLLSLDILFFHLLSLSQKGGKPLNPYHQSQDIHYLIYRFSQETLF